MTEHQHRPNGGIVRYARLLVSFCLMIGLGLLMAHGIAPGGPVQERLDLPGWIDDPGNSVANVFFALAALNLLIVWAWLIRCAAKGDFLRLAEGILVGSAVVGTLLFLTTHLLLSISAHQDRRDGTLVPVLSSDQTGPSIGGSFGDAITNRVA